MDFNFHDLVVKLLDFLSFKWKVQNLQIDRLSASLNIQKI